LRYEWFPFFNYAFSQGPLVFDQLSTFISYVCHENPFKISFLVVLIKIKVNEAIVEKQEGQYLGLFLISITYTFWILPWTIMHVGWPCKAFESFPSINIETSLGKSKVLMWCPHFNMNFLIVPKIQLIIHYYFSQTNLAKHLEMCVSSTIATLWSTILVCFLQPFDKCIILNH